MPVVAAGGTKETGGIVRAAAEVTAEVHAFAPAPHAFSRGIAGCGVGATVNLDDVVIQGPPGPVQVKLHGPVPRQHHSGLYRDDRRYNALRSAPLPACFSSPRSTLLARVWMCYGIASRQWTLPSS